MSWYLYSLSLPILHTIHNILLLKMLARSCLAYFRGAQPKKIFAILFGQELGLLDAAGKDEWDKWSGNCGRSSIDEEDPSPGPPSSGAIHSLTDAVSYQTADCTGDGGSGEEIAGA